MVKKQRLQFRSFDGGLNQKLNPAMLENNQFQQFQNFDFTDFGLAGQRNGESRFGARVGDEPVDGLAIFRPEGQADEVLIFSGGSVYVATLTGNVETTAEDSSLASGVPIETAQISDLMFIADGSNRLKKYDGSSVSLAGIEEPDSDDQSGTKGGAPTLSSGSSPGITGTFKYVVTYISPTTESDPSEASNEITVSDEVVELSDIPTSDNPDVEARGIYRTQDGGATFLKVDEISDNSTTTYSDDAADSDLGNKVDRDGGVPPSGLIDVEEYHNFLFGAGVTTKQSRLYWSSQLEPERWDELNFADIQTGRGTGITALKSFQDSLVIFKDVGVSFINGYSEKEFQISDAFTQVGAPSPRAVTTYGGSLYFYDGEDTIFRMSGRNLDPISFPIEPDLASITKPEDVVLEVDSKGQLHVAWFTEQDRGREFIYRVDREAWIKNTGRKVSDYARRLNDTLLAGSSEEGQIYEFDKSTRAEGLQFIETDTGDQTVLDKRSTGRQFLAEERGTVNKVSVRLKKNSSTSGGGSGGSSSSFSSLSLNLVN